MSDNTPKLIPPHQVPDFAWYASEVADNVQAPLMGMTLAQLQALGSQSSPLAVSAGILAIGANGEGLLECKVADNLTSTWGAPDETLVTGQKFFKGRTAAQLLALTEDEVSAGDLARVEDQGGRIVEAQTPGPSSTTWAQRATEIFRYAMNAQTVAEEYLFVGGWSASTSLSGEERFLMPYAGEVRRWIASSSSDPGSTTLKVYAGDTNADTEVDSVTDTASGDSGNYRVTANFTSASFAANQILALSCTPSNDPGFQRGWIEIEFLKPLEA